MKYLATTSHGSIIGAPRRHSTAFRGLLTGISIAVFVVGSDRIASAADGTWILNGSDNWSTTADWSGGIVPSGAGFTANFTNDITADCVITLDIAPTIGNIIFGDADPSTPASWTISGANTLTLNASTPTITVNALGSGAGATIGSVVAGTAGLTKAGVGTLTLSAVNSYSGTTAVNAGTLIVDPTINQSATFAFSSSTYTVSSGATLRFDGSNITNGTGFSYESAGAVTVSAGGTVQLYSNATNHNNVNSNCLGISTTTFTGSGNINMEGGGVIDLNATNALSAFQGTLNINNGRLTLQGGNTSTVGNFGVQFNGGTLDIRTDNMKVGTLNGSGTITKSSSFNVSTLTIGCDNGSGTFSGNITSAAGTLAITKSGTGTETFSGTNNYPGTTTVSAGTLIVSGIVAGSSTVVSGGSLQVASGGTDSSTTVTLSSGSIVDNGTISNAATVSGGTLSGTGTMGGLVTVNTGGTLAPGQSGTGFLTLQNGLKLNSGGHLSLTLDGATVGTQYPTVSVTGGSVTLGGDLQLSLGYTPAVGDIFYVVVNQQANPISGTFSNAADQGNGTGLITAGGDQFLVSYAASYASSSFTGGQDIALKVMAVPEPGTWSAILGGAGILLGLRRRRR